MITGMTCLSLLSLYLNVNPEGNCASSKRWGGWATDSYWADDPITSLSKEDHSQGFYFVRANASARSSCFVKKAACGFTDCYLMLGLLMGLLKDGEHKEMLRLHLRKARGGSERDLGNPGPFTVSKRRTPTQEICYRHFPWTHNQIHHTYYHQMSSPFDIPLSTYVIFQRLEYKPTAPFPVNPYWDRTLFCTIVSLWRVVCLCPTTYEWL